MYKDYFYCILLKSVPCLIWLYKCLVSHLSLGPSDHHQKRKSQLMLLHHSIWHGVVCSDFLYFKRINTSICFCWGIKKLFLECPFCWRSFVPSERGDVCYTWRAVANFTISSSISWVIKFVFIWSPFDRLGCLFEPRFITQLWPLEVIWSLHLV